MRTLTSLALLSLLALTGCAPASSPQDNTANPGSSTQQSATLTFNQITQDVQDGAKFYDVRSPQEYKQGNFGITENLPLAQLKEGKLPDINKDTLIYVHCEQGNWSAQAATILREAGYTQVIDLGGLKDVQALGGTLNP